MRRQRLAIAATGTALYAIMLEYLGCILSELAAENVRICHPPHRFERMATRQEPEMAELAQGAAASDLDGLAWPA